MKYRIIKIITALALCLSLCSTWAFAAGLEPDTGLEYAPLADNKHGGTCPVCREEVSEEHTWEDVVCSVCNSKAVAKVETSDGTTIYLGESDFANAFDDTKYNNVTVTLLSDIQSDSIDMGGTRARVHIFNTCTLDLEGHTITGSDTTIYIWPKSNLTIQDSSSGKTGQVVSTGGVAINTNRHGVIDRRNLRGKPSDRWEKFVYKCQFAAGKLRHPDHAALRLFRCPGKSDALEENQRELTGTVIVKECTHQGWIQDKGDGTHGGDCPYCGMEFTAAPHTLGVGNKCEGCKAELKVQVEISGATTYYGTIENVWNAVTAKGVTSAEITLLANVTETLFLPVSSGRKITLNGGSYTHSVMGFDVYGGQLDITGGTFEFTNGNLLRFQAASSGSPEATLSALPARR